MSSKKATVVRPPSQVSISIEPACLDVRDAAAFLSTSPHAIRQLVYLHALPSFKLGKKLIMSVTDLRAYVDAQRKAQQ